MVIAGLVSAGLLVAEVETPFAGLLIFILRTNWYRPYAAKIERKIPSKAIHLSATNDSSKGKTIHENEAAPLINRGILSNVLFFICLNPIIPVGTSRPSTTTNKYNKFFGL